MGFYIKGMEIPQDTCEIRITIDQDGDWWARRLDTDGEWHEVVEVPTPHGDLIEREMVHELVNWTIFKPPFSRKQVRRFIDDAPTIIEAEEGE